MFTIFGADCCGDMADSKNTLLVRHLPSDLTPAEKKDLISHFGAENVRVMGIRGRMKYTAFATFTDHDNAQEALTQLHQLEVLGSRLVVEFAKESQKQNFPTQKGSKIKTVKEEDQKDDVVKDDAEADLPKASLPSSDKTYTKWSLDYPRNPRLNYLYPPPNISIISNIANAVAACPKLYIQVLHLMNKMNLPTPFGPLTAQPPLAYEQPVPPPQPSQAQASSTEESEIESDEDTSRTVFGEKTSKRKRQLSSKPLRPRKVPKLLPEKDVPRPVPSGPVLYAKDMFEQTIGQTVPKKIQMKLPETVVIATSSQPITEQAVADTENDSKEVGGFGKIVPTEKPSEEIELTDSSLPYTVDSGRFLSPDQLRKGRISSSEMKNFSVFRRYEAGEPTTRLYIKNLAKHTTEQDLVNMYGQYVNWKSELHKTLFDVRLMKEGRMKGQAFITFPTEESAGHALKDTNGYVINTKPMVVQFARSAKAKD